MSKEAVFTVKLDAGLRDAFMAEAAATDRPPAQLISDLVREFVNRQREMRDHDTWFREEIEQALREANNPQGRLVQHEEVRSNWHRQRAELLKRAGSEPA